MGKNDLIELKNFNYHFQTTVEFEGPCTAEMGNCKCPKTMDKVCGMDDKTYNNEVIPLRGCEVFG